MSETLVVCPNVHAATYGEKLCITCHMQLNYMSLFGKATTEAAIENIGKIPLLDKRDVVLGIGGIGSKVASSYFCLPSAATKACYAIDVDESFSTDSRLPYGYLIAGAGKGGTHGYTKVGETMAQNDSRLVDEGRKMGLHLAEKCYTVFALGGGTGSGVGPSLLSLISQWPSKQLVVASIPSSKEAPISKYNAFCALGRIFGWPRMPDALVLIDVDKISGYRAIDVSGNLQNEFQVLARMVNMMVEMRVGEPLSKIGQASGTCHMAPALALTHDMEIFGSLANVLDSALARPLASIDYDTVTTCLTLVVGDPNVLTDAEKAFSKWSSRNFRSLKSAELLKLPKEGNATDTRRGVIDVAILMGGYDLEGHLETVTNGFKDYGGFFSERTTEAVVYRPDELTKFESYFNNYVRRVKKLAKRRKS